MAGRVLDASPSFARTQRIGWHQGAPVTLTRENDFPQHLAVGTRSRTRPTQSGLCRSEHHLGGRAPQAIQQGPGPQVQNGIKVSGWVTLPRGINRPGTRPAVSRCALTVAGRPRALHSAWTACCTGAVSCCHSLSPPQHRSPPRSCLQPKTRVPAVPTASRQGAAAEGATPRRGSASLAGIKREEPVTWGRRALQLL